MFQQRTWILQRANIELLRECQRCVSDQFSEKLSLTQTDLLEKIFYFSTQSQHKPFHEAVERLKHSLVEAAFDITTLPGYVPEDQLSHALDNSVVAESEDSALNSGSLDSGDDSGDLHEKAASPVPVVSAPKAKRVRMYRGREVVIEEPVQPTSNSKAPNTAPNTTPSSGMPPEHLLQGEEVTAKAKPKRIYRGRVIG